MKALVRLVSMTRSPFGDGKLDQRFPQLDSGIVHEDIDRDARFVKRCEGFERPRIRR